MKGVIANFISSYFQQPWFEWWGDTLPIAKIGIDQDNTIDFRSKFVFTFRKKPLTPRDFLNINSFSIYEDEVLTTNLSQSDSNLFSAFRINPSSLQLQGDYNLYLFPLYIIWELVEIYGIRLLELPYGFFLEAKDTASLNTLRETIASYDTAAFKTTSDTLLIQQADLDIRRVIIDSVSSVFYYSGTLIVKPNRFYRPGLTLNLLNSKDPSNNWLFYIEEVTHNVTAGAWTTTLKVSHGLSRKGYNLIENLLSFNGANGKATTTRLTQIALNRVNYYKLVNKDY